MSVWYWHMRIVVSEDYALHYTIEKFKKVLEGVELLLDVSNCPLCVVRNVHGLIRGPRCADCPVYNAGQHCFNPGSLYQKLSYLNDLPANKRRDGFIRDTILPFLEGLEGKRK